MKLQINKKITSICSGLFLAFILISFLPKTSEAQGPSYQQFYNDLAPYGNWLQDPQYGYVWSPNVSRDFRPYYTNGHWVMTEYGNMWMSNYQWGWATFHYGRWVLNDYYGWLWIPGSEWAPAWVSWRQGGGYYGWAPLGPGISINISFGNNYYVPANYWNFVPYKNIYSRSFRRYAPRRNNVIINNTTIINNTYVDNRTRNTYITGPRRNEVEKNVGRSVKVYQVNQRNDRAGNPRISGDAVAVYRPNLERAQVKGQDAAPRSAQPIRKPISVPENRANRAVTQPVEQRVTPNSNRSTAPVENRAPQRPTPQTAPSRQVTPQRPTPQTAPSRQVTPQRQTPQAAPSRQVTPQRQTPQAAPSRQVTPQRPTPQAAPSRQVTPRTQNSRGAKSTNSNSRSGNSRSSNVNSGR